jgi:penicillin amidase
LNLNRGRQKWSFPDIKGLLGNIGQELEIGRAVALIGPDKVKDLLWLHPQEPVLDLDPKIDQQLLFEDLLAPYFAFRKGVQFEPRDLQPEYRTAEAISLLNQFNELSKDSLAIGSNNWVVAGSKTVDGNTYMANDPHRTIAVPSLRYMAHLVAPGWNVIGGGEPEIPGISIGHNGIGAWGLTVFRTDGEDLYQYELNPKNPLQYKYKGEWKDFKIIEEVVKVKDGPNETIKLYYSHHGPITYLNKKALKAYGVRCAWLEPGGSPYLASLRMDQAQNWEEFRDACNYSHIPGENMIWADKNGTIGWQAVGIAPVRNHSSGLVPVPGDGSYDWDGYLPIIQKPNELNPKSGFIATANQNVTPEDYKHWNAIGFSWSDPYRGDRVNEFLESKNHLNMEDMRRLQTDVASLPARTLIPLLLELPLDPQLAQLQNKFSNWDQRLEPTSIEAGIYVAWEDEIQRLAHEKFVPENVKKHLGKLQLKRILDWIQKPKDSPFKSDSSRNSFLMEAFKNAVGNLKKSLGEEPLQWQYGQEAYKHSSITHALGAVASSQYAKKLNLPSLPRGGNAYTPGSTGSNKRQSSGASFRMIVNTGDWDATIGTNAPGQSGNPDSPFYTNLYEDWAKDVYFPVYYSKEKIEEHLYKRTLLTP